MMKINNVLWGIGLAVLSACAGGKSAQPFERIDADKELAYCDAQLHRALDSLRKGDTIDYTMEPRNIYPGESAWNCRKATKEEWTAGFWPGVLWYDYEATGNDSIRKEAERFTESLGFLATIPAYDHDLGFLVYCSYGNGYRLTQNPGQRFTIEELSREYLINTSTLKSVFKAVYGQPIAAYMRSYRIRRAMELLQQTDDSIAAIAAAVGYETQGKFTKAFKEATQLLPRDYRKTYRKAPR